MKKSTIFLLVAVVVLAVVTFLVTSKSSAPAAKKLEVAGYATPEQLAAEKSRGMMDEPVHIDIPVDEIIIERPPREGGQAGGVAGLEPLVRLVRTGTGKEATWKLAAPVDAPAVKYQVERIVEPFKSPSVSKYSRALKEADLARYDFEPARRVRVTLKANGQVWNGADLVIGRVEKGEAGPDGGADADTWVMKADDPSTAYLIAGKDLRAAVDADLGSFRDKKVFGFEADDLTRIEVESPTGDKVVLVGTKTEVPAAPDAAPGPGAPPDADAKPTTKVEWALSEPAGVKADSGTAAYAKGLAGLRVQDFVPLARAEPDAKAALAGKTWVVRGALADGKTVVLRVADGDKDPVWAQVEGKDELLSLQAYAAKNLRKGIAELKDKAVWDVPADDVTELRLQGEQGPITVTRATGGAPGTWSFVEPALAYPADPSAVLKSVAKLTALRWARADERDAARAALATPDIQASLKTRDGAAREVRFSKPNGAGEGENDRWGVVGDPASGEPFLIQDFNAKRFVTGVDALRWKKLIAADKDQIVRVEVTPVGATAPTVLERPSTGGELAVVDAPAGKKTKEEAARTLAATLVALDAKSFHEGKAPTETGLAAATAGKVVVKLADGQTTTLLISTTQAGEGSVYAIADTGPLANTVVAINEYQAKNLVKAQSDFLDDVAAAP